MELDIFRLSKRNQRKRTYVRITQRMVADNLAELPMINATTLERCLGSIWENCRSYNVSYHNDMHNLDVGQMTYIILKTGPDSMATILELTPIE